MHELAQRLCHFIRRADVIHPGDRVGVAVSGGPDSVALLRLLLELRTELGIVLAAVHVNHKLRGNEADSDAEFVAGLAHEHGLQLYSTVADVAQHASQTGISIETAARELRYKFLRQLLGETTATRIHGAGLDKIATGHTLDDQAETVLMRIIRGTGMRGLRAIQPRIQVGQGDVSREIIRPLLEIRRAELQGYLREIGQSWRDDATNADMQFTRNRVRQVLIPLLEREFNPAVSGCLAELAEIARAEQEFWDSEAEGWIGTGIHFFEQESSCSGFVNILSAAGASTVTQASTKPRHTSALVDLAWLLSEELAVQRRIIRVVGDHLGFSLDFEHVQEVLRFAAEEQRTGKELSLPSGWTLRYGEDALEFVAAQTGKQQISKDYELVLTVPGEVTIPQIGSKIEAVRLDSGAVRAHEDQESLFNLDLLSKELIVRNWRAGDRFWPAHTKGPRKIKQMLQDAHVPQRSRSGWPVVVSGTEIVWVRGFPGRAQMRPAEDNAAVLIRELPLGEQGKHAAETAS